MSFEHNSIIRFKDNNWLERQKIAGKCVAGILKTLNQLIIDKTPNLSLKDMEAEALKQIKAADCVSTFKGYKGFPGEICLSVNKQLVHGIPSNYILQEGDVVKFDLGATYQGAIADAAATAIYGEPKSPKHVELIAVCKESLNQAINAIKINKQLGCIGYAIHKYVTSKSNFGLIVNYGGHGIDENIPHAPPFIANKSKVTEGARIQEGLTIAIEPMLVIGDNRTRISNDGWTVVTSDIGAHFEHSIYVGADKVHVVTEW
jgi:methionyl aminopeptidase